jgi:hypothetical protein
VVERDPVGKHFTDLDGLILLSEFKKDREGKMLKVEKMMMEVNPICHCCCFYYQRK